MENVNNFLLGFGSGKFLQEIEEFPSSLNESTMLYNYGKLLQIIQEKELLSLVKDRDLINRTHNLSQKFSDITKKIILKSATNTQILAQYKKLQRKIEEELTGMTYIFAKQWGISVLALFHYKNGEYNKAINQSLECIVLNEYLIRSGVSTLLFRAAEQNKNIMKILFRSSDCKTAGNFARDFLSYLFNGASKLQKGKIFYEKKYWRNNPYIREGYSYECFRSVVSLTIHLQKRLKVSSKELFFYIFSELDFEVNNPDRDIISTWLHLKKLCYSGKYLEFRTEVFDFFKTPISKIYDILKVDLILEIQQIIEEDTTEVGREAHISLTKFMYDKLNAQFYLDTDLSLRNLVKQ